MSDSTRITRAHFHQFKAFANYSLSLEHLNILVGPNNSGKSTIIGAVRALASSLRIARNKSPERIMIDGDRLLAYRVPETSLPISLENVHTDYAAGDSHVTFSFNNRNSLRLHFPESGGCFLIPEARGESIRSPGAFRRNFPVALTVVPVLGPVEHCERRRERDTVVAGLSTHRASRHFRSYWHYFPEGFDAFADLVKRTWPGMEIQRPEVADIMTGELAMFCLEGRMTRELYWAGFGFQVWCQLLTHLSRAQDTTLLVVDEPEIYLHPDVQRQLLTILRESGPDILLATHSTEIMAEADPSEIVLVDKGRQTADRLKDIAGVQRAMDLVGSVQNITLTALARNRRVLFVEGDQDFRILRRLARKLGLSELGTGTGITALESGGFGSWRRVTILAEGIGQALGTNLRIAAVYDRDYFCAEDVSQVTTHLAQHLALAHVHSRKEIENYLLIPEALDRAIARASADRSARLGTTAAVSLRAADLLRDITDKLKDEVQSQLIARRTTYLRTSGRDLADITRETLTSFTSQWDDLRLRLGLVPGKEVLGAFRERVHSALGISLTDARIVDAMRVNEIPDDLVSLLRRLDAFRQAPT
jgi:energy-coupling factor transporter ATP-binding protein EcfA2